MNIARGLLLALLSLPILEIYLLIKLGGFLGFLPILLLLLTAASAGVYLLQTQSWSAWQKIQLSLARGELPTTELLDATLIMAGALLLLLPGFLSDLLGLLCLIPATRRSIGLYLVKHYNKGFAGDETQNTSPGSKVIEGEFKRED